MSRREMAMDELPTRAQDLADAWRRCAKAMREGTMLSIESAHERRLILREAREEGILDEVVGIVTGSDWYSDEHETLADRKFADSQREDE